MGKASIVESLTNEVNLIGNQELRKLIISILGSLSRGRGRPWIEGVAVENVVGHTKAVVYYANKLSLLYGISDPERDDAIVMCLLGSLVGAVGAEKTIRAIGRWAEGKGREILVEAIEMRWQGDAVIEHLTKSARIVLCAGLLVAPKEVFSILPALEFSMGKAA